MRAGWIGLLVCVWIGAAATLLTFCGAVWRFPRPQKPGAGVWAVVCGDDRLLAGLLCSAAVFMMYYFY